MKLDQKLVDAAIAFTEYRFPGVVSEGAAAMYTDEGEILVSTALEVPEGSSVQLCHEVGAMCEAYAKKKLITATVCVSRAQDGRFIIVSLCGVCMERMWLWGGDVEIAVPREDDATRWRAIKLKEANPYYWRKPLLV